MRVVRLKVVSGEGGERWSQWKGLLAVLLMSSKRP